MFTVIYLYLCWKFDSWYEEPFAAAIGTVCFLMGDGYLFILLLRSWLS